MASAFRLLLLLGNALGGTFGPAALQVMAQGTSAASGNPFVQHPFYVNPANSQEYAASISTATGKVKDRLREMQKVPSAYWIDVKAKIRGTGTRSVQGILQDASSKSPAELVVLIWYDLPNRDCDAKASNGEICCTYGDDGRCDYLAPGNCADGIKEYETEYVDPFVEVLQAYQDRLPIVVVVEPDSLPNIATNTGHPKCGNKATRSAYMKGVKYALEQITSKAPGVSVYLDAAHGGWVGWENNLEKFMSMLQEMHLPLSKVRGFALNVANYQALGIQCPWRPDQAYRNGYCMNGKHASDPCCEDPCDLLSQWNFGNNEHNYAAGLVAAARGELGMDAHVIIDTGRNGVVDERMDAANWCNPRNAGAGVKSTAKTANTSLVDAYFWLKTPGESDGCSQTLPDGKKCPRFDSGCASVDSLGTKHGEPPAPEAGHWYDYQVKQLAANAVFELPGSAGGGAAGPAPTPSGGAQFTTLAPSPLPSPLYSTLAPSPLPGPRYSTLAPNLPLLSTARPTLRPMASSTSTPSLTLAPAPIPTWTTSPAPAPLPQVPSNAYVAKPEKDCFSGSNAYHRIGHVADCRSECLYKYRDCVAVVIWGNMCFFRNNPECGASLRSSPGHTVYLRADLAGQASVQAPSPAQSPSPSVPTSAFQRVEGKDCFSGQNAFVSSGNPKTCRSDCLTKFPGCTAVVMWRSYCFFRSKAGCSSNAVDSPEHTLYIRSTAAAAGQQVAGQYLTARPTAAAWAGSPGLSTASPSLAYGSAQSPQQAAAAPAVAQAGQAVAFMQEADVDCYSGHNAYDAEGDPRTCMSDCLTKYSDCVAVVVWKHYCFFRNQAACSNNLVKSPGHTLYLVKARMAMRAIMQRKVALGDAEQWAPPDRQHWPAGAQAFSCAAGLVVFAAVAALATRTTRGYERLWVQAPHGHEVLVAAPAAEGAAESALGEPAFPRAARGWNAAS